MKKWLIYIYRTLIQLETINKVAVRTTGPVPATLAGDRASATTDEPTVADA